MQDNNITAEQTENKFVRFLKNVLPWKGDPAGEIARKSILLISVLVMLAGCVYFIDLGVKEYQNNKMTKMLEDSLEDIGGREDWEKAWVGIKKKYPGVDFPEGMNPKFADLYVRNPDMVGWLSIENTNINFPIVQGKTNNDYLHKSFDGKNTKYGNPFMDARNNPKQLDLNTVLHGHHMRTGKQVFTDLTKYRTVDGFKKSPVIKFSTLYGDYSWKVYAVMITNANPKDDDGYMLNYLFTNLNTEQNYKDYIKELDRRKLYTTGVDIKPTDRILTLSTCEYDWDDARLVVVARMVRKGESEEVDVSKAEKNYNPKFPQVYYEKRDLDNPFKKTERWYPN